MNFTIILLIILTLISRIVGMAREMTIAYFYGATAVGDAYFVSLAIPTVIMTCLTFSLATSYVPVYQKLPANKADKHLFTNKAIGITLLIGLLTLIVAQIFAPQLVRLFAVGFDENTMRITTMLTRITLFAVFLMGINHLLQGLMQVKEKVLLASLSGLPFNFVATIFIIISAYTNLPMLAIGTVVALGAQSLYLLTLAHRQQFRLKPQLDFKDSNVQNLIVLSLPIILANTVDQLGLVVDKNIASTFGTGAISALTYATRTTTAISAVFVTSILVMTFPKIARLVATNNLMQMKEALSQAIVGMNLFVIPVIATVAMFSYPLTSLLFGRGAFDDSAVLTTSNLLFFLAFFLFGSGMFALVARVFYALGDSKTPMIVATVKVIINLFLNVVLTALMGISGLALATSISSLTGMAILIVLLRRKIGSLRLKNTLISLNKITGASLVMVVFAYFFYHFIAEFHELLALFVAAIAGSGLYLLLILILRIKEVEQLVALAISKVRTFVKKKKL